MKNLLIVLLIALTSTTGFAAESCNTKVQNSIDELYKTLESIMGEIIVEMYNPDQTKMIALKKQQIEATLKFCAEYKASYKETDSCLAKNSKSEVLELTGKATYAACQNSEKELKELP